MYDSVAVTFDWVVCTISAKN